jgi:hypothetical protein
MRPQPTPPHRYTLALRAAARAAGPHRPGFNALYRRELAARGLRLDVYNEHAVPRPEDYPFHGQPMHAPAPCPDDPDGWAPSGTVVCWRAA